MNEFTKALVSKSKNNNIPDEHNLFGRLVGEWDFDYIDNQGTEEERHIKGEWIFSWILEGTAIQDLFICPSRKERCVNIPPDAEYGTTIRLYNPESQKWDVFYGCTGGATRLEAAKEGDAIVLTEVDEQNMKWIFSEMTDTSFHWRNYVSEDGEIFLLNCELFATRRTK